MTNDLGEITNLEVMNQFVDLAGKWVVDAGCGSLTFSQILLDQGARVLAIDPDPIQAELNRRADPTPNLEFVESGAETIPAPASSVDGVVFSYSLHHIPAKLYPQVFSEVERVLKQDGFLYVIEPLTCPLNEVMKLFHDEDQERAAAQQALQEIAVPMFRSVKTVTYHSVSQYESWDDFANHYASRSFNTLYSESDVRQPHVQAAFERLGGPEHRFQSPKQAMFLEKPIGE